ncbi:hypothetical protein [Undibacter mobilis]|uniref:Uncharacterized protein n=1 Tax=Undibacter mobilis TaxID=2292256 RepID=A0A371B7Z1_9BRAD|nr:hypothetical protein [Undibacter mobilis]RDV03627.1 hypothetical protein DXH78_02915 [Undibacter mobilis]
MALLDIFRRRPAVRDRDELADFIDRNAAFLIQKAIYEYSRARAGHYSKVLFKEPSFHAAVEVSRWRAYPLGLLMVTEVVYAVLCREGAHPAQDEFDGLESLVLSVFDRYPVPQALGPAEWEALRADLAQRLKQIALHPPKRAMDIPEPYAKPYFDLMPIHEKLRGRDLETTRNYLMVTLCNIHDELTKASGGLSFPALATAV